MSASPSRIGIIGGGWRASTFLRIAQALPAEFRISTALVRSKASADALRAQHGIVATTSFDHFLRNDRYDYVVVCTPRAVTPDYIVELSGRGTPVLAETPPAADVESLEALYARLPVGARVQVAEQYAFQPQHAARLAVARSGLLGTVTSAYASVAHDYHGISLLRSLLGVADEPVRVTAEAFEDSVIETLGLSGWAAGSAARKTTRVTARMTVPDRGLLGVYEFDGDQYFSPIRSRRLSVFGERGELADNTIHYMRGPGDPVTLRLSREETGVDGDLAGRHLRRILAGDRVVYENPFAPARLSDDEIAIATVLAKMNEYSDGGPAFYGLADASQDTYVAALISEAVETGAAVSSTPRPWSGDLLRSP